MVGTVTIGSIDGGAVEEAKRQIKLILNPPTADVGQVYHGPGRQHHQVRCVRQHPPGPRRPAAHLQDGRRQAHRPGRGRARARRRDRGPVDDVDPNGKVSLSPVNPLAGGGGGGGCRRRRRRRSAGARRRAAAPTSVSFEDAFDAELRAEFGDLGPGRRPVAATAATVAVTVAATAAVVAAQRRARRAASRRAVDPALRRCPRASASSPSGCPSSRSAAIGAYVGVGGRDEADDLAGASATSSSTCCSRAPPTASAREIAEAIDATGGDMNAYTSREHTAFYARVPARDRGHGARAARRRAVGARAPARRGRRRARGDPRGAGRGRGQPRGRRAHARWPRRCSPSHPLGREVLGTEASIEAMAPRRHRRLPRRLVPAGQPRRRRRRRRRPRRGAAPRSTASWAPVPAASGRRGAAPVVDAVSEVVARHPVEQAHLALGWRGRSTTTTPTATPLAFANHVLGGGTASRLFQEIREERGLAYTVFSSVSLNVDRGAAHGLRRRRHRPRSPRCSRSSTTQVASLVADGITDDEHRVALGYLEGSLAARPRGHREPHGPASGARVCSRRGRSTVDEHLDRLRAVTPDDVHRVLRRVLGGPRALVAVGPFDELPS